MPIFDLVCDSGHESYVLLAILLIVACDLVINLRALRHVRTPRPPHGPVR